MFLNCILQASNNPSCQTLFHSPSINTLFFLCACLLVLTGVHATVVFHMVSQLERLAAELALKRPIAGVHRQMRDQRRHVRKAFATELAQHHVARIVGRTVRRHRAEAAAAAHAGQAAQSGRTEAAHRGGRRGHRGGKLNVQRRRPIVTAQTVHAERLRRRAATGAAAGARTGTADARKVHVALRLAVLERAQRVRQNVSRQFALVRKRGAAVYALEYLAAAQLIADAAAAQQRCDGSRGRCAADAAVLRRSVRRVLQPNRNQTLNQLLWFFFRFCLCFLDFGFLFLVFLETFFGGTFKFVFLFYWYVADSIFKNVVFIFSSSNYVADRLRVVLLGNGMCVCVLLVLTFPKMLSRMVMAIIIQFSSYAFVVLNSSLRGLNENKMQTQFGGVVGGGFKCNYLWLFFFVVAENTVYI